MSSRHSEAVKSHPAKMIAPIMHDLRMLLSSINGYASILLTGEIGGLNDRQRDSVERITGLVQSLTRLLSNLLVLAKSGGEPVLPTQRFVSINQLSKDVMDWVSGEGRRKKIRLVIQLPKKEIFYWCESDDLKHIILNLLSNAVRFTDKGGQVTLKVSAGPKTMTIQVTDTGVGITPKDRSKIFEEFYHVDRPDVGAGAGSGLGLAIVKRMVETYHGEILVTSKVGHGSSFQVRLPIQDHREIMIDYLGRVLHRARGARLGTGLFLYQIRAGRAGAPGKIRAVQKSDKGILDLLERVLRSYLREDDQVFRLNQNSFLILTTMLDSKGFSTVNKRLRHSFKNDPFIKKLSRDRKLRWRLVNRLVPGKLIELFEKELKKDWKS
jgi:anti-sigma regulatory factor (Ser/Thr protein kinase)